MSRVFIPIATFWFLNEVSLVFKQKQHSMAWGWSAYTLICSISRVQGWAFWEIISSTYIHWLIDLWIKILNRLLRSSGAADNSAWLEEVGHSSYGSFDIFSWPLLFFHLSSLVEEVNSLLHYMPLLLWFSILPLSSSFALLQWSKRPTATSESQSPN